MNIRMFLHKRFHWFTACWHWLGKDYEYVIQSHDINRKEITVRHKTDNMFECCICNKKQHLSSIEF